MLQATLEVCHRVLGNAHPQTLHAQWLEYVRSNIRAAEAAEQDRRQGCGAAQRAHGRTGSLTDGASRDGSEGERGVLLPVTASSGQAPPVRSALCQCTSLVASNCARLATLVSISGCSSPCNRRLTPSTSRLIGQIVRRLKPLVALLRLVTHPRPPRLPEAP